MMQSPHDPSSQPTLLPGSLRRSATNLALLLAVVVGMLAAAEAVLYWVDLDRPDPPLYPGDKLAAQGIQADPFIGWKMPPDTAVRVSGGAEYDVIYHSDSMGFRRAASGGRPAARHRLLFLGDSFTFGAGVEDEQTFPRGIENDRADTRSYNLGMTGFGLDQMWRTLHHYGLRLSPSVVVLEFIDDDLHRSITAYRKRETRAEDGNDWWQKPTYRLEGDTLVPETESDRPGALTRMVDRHSRLLEMWRRDLWRLGLVYGKGPYWALNEAIFRAIRDECRDAGAHLLVVRIPSKGQWKPAPAIGSAMMRDGIDYLDLATVLPPQPLQYYFHEDPHLNAQGHEWVAREIERALAARGWEQPIRGDAVANPN